MLVYNGHVPVVFFLFQFTIQCWLNVRLPRNQKSRIHVIVVGDIMARIIDFSWNGINLICALTCKIIIMMTLVLPNFVCKNSLHHAENKFDPPKKNQL
jgi:hypothetical protein